MGHRRLIARIASLALIALAACTDRPDNVAGVPFVDCSDHSTTEPRCRHSAASGSVGGGDAWLVGSTLGSGFVAGTRLIVAAQSRDGSGSVFAIDLISGVRSVVSGVRTTSRYGAITVGNGPSLAGLSDVESGPDGWYALADIGIVRIDPSTGDRTLAFQLRESCMIGGPGFAVGSDGTVYAGGNYTSAIVAIHNGQCTTLSGDGPELETPAYFALTNDTLYVSDAGSESIFAVDIRTGHRERISSDQVDHVVGDGDVAVGGRPVSIASDGVWTSAESGTPVRIDPASGSRTLLALGDGPIDARYTGWAASGGAVWHHPRSPLLVATYQGGVLVIDALTGDSNWLSR